VISNVFGGTQRIALTGTSQAASVTATAMADFGAVDMDAPSPTQMVTLTNNGDAILNFTLARCPAAAPRSRSPAAVRRQHARGQRGQLTVTVTYHPTIEKPAGQSDSAVLVANLAGVLGGPTRRRSPSRPRHRSPHPGRRRPDVPPVFRNPGDQARSARSPCTTPATRCSRSRRDGH